MLVYTLCNNPPIIILELNLNNVLNELKENTSIGFHGFIIHIPIVVIAFIIIICQTNAYGPKSL